MAARRGGLQPYKRKRQVGPPGSALHAMRQGRPAGLPNPASLAQALSRLANAPMNRAAVTRTPRPAVTQRRRTLRDAMRSRPVPATRRPRRIY